MTDSEPRAKKRTNPLGIRYWLWFLPWLVGNTMLIHDHSSAIGVALLVGAATIYPAMFIWRPKNTKNDELSRLILLEGAAIGMGFCFAGAFVLYTLQNDHVRFTQPGLGAVFYFVVGSLVTGTAIAWLKRR